MDGHPLTPVLLRMTSFDPRDRVDVYGSLAWCLSTTYFDELKQPSGRKLTRQETVSAFIAVDTPLPELAEKTAIAKLQKSWITVDLAKQASHDSK
jgi:hypothetical protein